MKSTHNQLVAASVIAALFSLASPTPARADQAPAKPAAAKPSMAKICINCHQAQPNTLRGYFDNVAFKSKTIQLKIDDVVELVKFDEDDIKVVNGEGKSGDGELLRKTPKGHEIKIEYVEKDGVKNAVRLVEKGPIKLPADMLLTTADVEKLVALGPEKGKYFLYDSRPAPRFQEGAIPTAVNLPFPAFDKLASKLLPQDKNALLIFYCAGPHCNMSPGSADKAKKLGYTNIKVYKDGMPAWSAKRFGVLTPQAVKEAWLDKQIPFVLLDARPAAAAQKGFIKDAVTFPAAKAAKLAKSLNIKQKKAPIFVYDQMGGKDAEKVAAELIKTGYGNVRIITGGFEGWKAGNLEVAAGKLAAKAAYVPKPRQGEIDVEEFKRYVEKLPANVMIIDVRNADEVKKGMLKTAVNISAEELKDKAASIPKDKLVITQCSTGVRAEMAYHALRELGYTNLKFVNANIDFEKGGYKITKE